MTTKTVTMALARLRPVLVSLVREGRDEQHMNAIHKRSANSTKMQNPIGRGRFAPSSPEASIGLGPSQQAIAGRCCAAATGGMGDHAARSISKPRQKLANA